MIQDSLFVKMVSKQGSLILSASSEYRNLKGENVIVSFVHPLLQFPCYKSLGPPFDISYLKNKCSKRNMQLMVLTKHIYKSSSSTVFKHLLNILF